VDVELAVTADQRTRTEKVKDLALSPGGRKMIKYTFVSVISVIVSQIVLGSLYYFAGWTARASNIAGCCVATVPSYYLNRHWVWRKGGRSHFLKEVVPFWALAFIGLAFSTWAADYAETHAHDLTDSRGVQTIIVLAAALGAFGVLWIGKFILFNKIIFAHHPEELEEIPALDGRTGLPI
jgi:putative flippase GtrA